MSIFDFFKKKVETKSKSDLSGKNDISIRHTFVSTNRIDLSLANINTIRNYFIAFDVETTGLNPSTDRIVEIGAVLFLNGKVSKTFSSLVNPGISISQAASSVNHITNEMLAAAPSEKEVYRKLSEFLKDALQGNTVMCAHNAKFDFDFLSNTLARLGFDAKIRYLDTLRISKEYLRGLKNYKQCSIEEYFGLTNLSSHRAASDAENCGHILYHLLDFAEKSFESARQKLEQSKPTYQELEVCAYIQTLIAKQGGDTELIRYRKNSGGYVDISCFYSFLKIKFSKKGKYILVKKNCPLICNYTTEPCTKSEGDNFIRVFFSSPFELESLSKYIFDEFSDRYKSAKTYMSSSDYAKQEVENNVSLMCALNDNEVSSLLKSISAETW